MATDESQETLMPRVAQPATKGVKSWRQRWAKMGRSTQMKQATCLKVADRDAWTRRRSKRRRSFLRLPPAITTLFISVITCKSGKGSANKLCLIFKPHAFQQIQRRAMGSCRTPTVTMKSSSLRLALILCEPSKHNLYSASYAFLPLPHFLSLCSPWPCPPGLRLWPMPSWV
jgi:hypothetical protein